MHEYQSQLSTKRGPALKRKKNTLSLPVRLRAWGPPLSWEAGHWEYGSRVPQPQRQYRVDGYLVSYERFLWLRHLDLCSSQSLLLNPLTAWMAVMCVAVQLESEGGYPSCDWIGGSSCLIARKFSYSLQADIRVVPVIESVVVVASPPGYAGCRRVTELFLVIE